MRNEETNVGPISVLIWTVSDDDACWIEPLGEISPRDISLADGTWGSIVGIEDDPSSAIARDLVLMQWLMRGARTRLYTRTTEEQRAYLTMSLGMMMPRSVHGWRFCLMDAVAYTAPVTQRDDLQRMVAELPEDELLCLVRDYKPMPKQEYDH